MLIHIGSRRSLSTWLQNNIFNKEDFFIIKNIQNKSRITKYFFNYDKIYNSLDDVKKDIETEIDTAKSQNKIPVITNEALEGDELNGNNASLIADFLKVISKENTKVLYIIRNQNYKILSLYKKYIAKGGFCSLKTFMKSSENLNSRYPYAFKKESLKYDKIVDYYSKLFGKENLLVLPYEMFVKTPDIFMEKILGLINKKEITFYNVNKKVNVQHFWINLHFYRVFNLILGNPTTFEGIIIQKLRNYSRSLCLRIFKIQFLNRYFNEKYLRMINLELNDYYNSSNEKTSKLININLNDYDY
tara:strand:- start:1861 stop:2766 length:906 start_codon:yes stop_codon:yes gene_type:complete